ncbi:hypothetical protein ROBYS_00440 [Roseobacter sp. OBYS 0001]|nr:hypothetical protein ROBYS_00440 [Roseobacter sp. OBYS 0001]
MFERLQLPLVPSLNDMAIGTFASFVMDAHALRDTVAASIGIIINFVFMLSPFSEIDR